ncbi:MAG TPA: LptA/OstA family protein [Candidatus Acidoferrum sp.]|nr:LptA/OstA family protein [Candidatus Acidoferrum sp.]
MRKSQAARYARWSAAAAFVCAAVTVGVYLKRGWTRYQEGRKAPPAPAVDVERQSTKLTFSKGEGTHIIFTVEASKSTEFKGLNASDLEGVKITIFGRDGARHDTLDTHTCRYTKDNGDIECAGDVEITLMSKAEWEAAAATSGSDSASSGKLSGPNAMKIQTREVAFNRASGEARTDQPVEFTFANGSGKAVGALYRSEEGTLQLQRDVRLKLDQPLPNKSNGKARSQPDGMPREPIEVSGSRMDFDRDAATMYLAGPAEAKTQSERLSAGGLLLNLDDSFHAKRLLAKGNGNGSIPEFVSAKGAGRQRLTAQEIAAEFAPQGWVTRAQANGQVSGEAVKGGEAQSVQAQNAAMEMIPGENAPKLLELKGDVDARTTGRPGGNSAKAPEGRKLTTQELRIGFAEKKGARGTQLQNAETVGTGRLEWNDAGDAGSKKAQTVLQADQLAMSFDAAGAARRLDAKGNVQTERTLADGSKQKATAGNGFVDLLERGGWSRMQLNDNVALNEGQRAARADQAVFAKAEQSATLSGHAVARDATSQTSAQKLVFWQATGDLRGEGNVRSSDLSARSTAIHLAPVASNITADSLTGNAKTGRAVYNGHARLWQGDSVLEAESIELRKSDRTLNAEGNVRAVFPQATANGNTGGKAASPAKPPVLWHAQSGKLTYWDAENRAHLSQNVVVQAPDQKMSGQDLDLYFTRSNGANGGAAAANQSGQGAQQISRAVGTGGVTVQQGERRATAERGEYTAADGKFVMSGGTPTLYDATEGTTTGRQLTFFLADATIIVDSENGSRTLTKHRVPK